MPTLIYTFSNLPSAYFGGESGMIFTPDEKEEALSEVGIDYLLMPQFDAEVAETPRETFARFLFQELKAKVVCVGFNYRFGKGALGGREGRLQHAYSLRAAPGEYQTGSRAIGPPL